MCTDELTEQVKDVIALSSDTLLMLQVLFCLFISYSVAYLQLTHSPTAKSCDNALLAEPVQTLQERERERERKREREREGGSERERGRERGREREGEREREGGSERERGRERGRE